MHSLSSARSSRLCNVCLPLNSGFISATNFPPTNQNQAWWMNQCTYWTASSSEVRVCVCLTRCERPLTANSAGASHFSFIFKTHTHSLVYLLAKAAISSSSWLFLFFCFQTDWKDVTCCFLFSWTRGWVEWKGGKGKCGEYHMILNYLQQFSL